MRGWRGCGKGVRRAAMERWEVIPCFDWDFGMEIKWSSRLHMGGIAIKQQLNKRAEVGIILL